MNINELLTQLSIARSECSLSCQKQERVHLDSITSSPILARTDNHIPLEDLVLPHTEAQHRVLWGPRKKLLDHPLKVQARPTAGGAPQLPPAGTLLII